MRDSGNARKITLALWRAMQEHGHTIGRTEKTMGVALDTLRGARNYGGLRLRHVTDALEALGIPPSVFFNDTFGGVSTTAVERFMARGAELAARKLVELPELSGDIKPDRLTEDDLARLDAARFENPRAAAEQAAGVARLAARDGRRGDAAAAVARQGSALRVAEMWEAAWVCVWWALRHAPDGPIKADTLARSAFIISDYGCFADAAEITAKSAVSQMTLGRPVQVSQALVNQGTFLRRDGSYDTAIQALKAALAFLPAREHRYRFCAIHNLGLANVAVEDFEEAEVCAKEAEDERQVPEGLRRYIPWLRARISLGKLEHSQAIEYFRETVQAFQDSPANAALAATELCRVYFEAGDPAMAARQAFDAAGFAIPKKQNPIVASAIMDLFRSAQAGSLSVRFLESVVKRMKHGLARRAASDSRPPRDLY